MCKTKWHCAGGDEVESLHLNQAKGWQTWRLLAEVRQQGWVQGAWAQAEGQHPWASSHRSRHCPLLGWTPS